MALADGAPPAPQGLQVIWAGDGVAAKQAVLAWTEPTGAPATYYRINISADGQAPMPACAGQFTIDEPASGPHCLIWSRTAMDPMSSATPGLSLGSGVYPPPAPFNAEAVVFNLQVSRTYSFQAGAANAAGMSPPSNTANVSFGAPGAASSRAYVFVNGVNTASDNYQTFQALQSAVGVAAFDYGYRGGSWSNGAWTPNPWTDGDSEQPLATSVTQLEAMVQSLRENGYNSVAVAGWSLGGLVAAQALAAADPSGRPDRVVTFDAPLQGLNVSAKAAVAQQIQAAASGLANLAALALGLSSASAAQQSAQVSAYVAAALPKGPIKGDVQNLYANPVARQTGAIGAALQHGAALASFANENDCFYDVAVCAPDVGASDSDDRSSMHLGVPGEQAVNVAEPGRSGWWNIVAAHEDVMHDPALEAQAAAFLSS